MLKLFLLLIFVFILYIYPKFNLMLENIQVLDIEEMLVVKGGDGDDMNNPPWPK